MRYIKCLKSKKYLFSWQGNSKYAGGHGNMQFLKCALQFLPQGFFYTVPCICTIASPFYLTFSLIHSIFLIMSPPIGSLLSPNKIKVLIPVIHSSYWVFYW